MKPKRQTNTASEKPRNKTDRGGDQRPATRRRIWLWLIAAFLAVTFLASECATLLPVE